MKISNHYLERQFHLDDVHFFTSKILNKKNNVVVTNVGQEEFLIHFEDGSSLSSKDMSAEIDMMNNDGIRVSFKDNGIKVLVEYYSKEDVLTKQITVVSSEKSINYIDCEVIEFQTMEDIYIPKKQKDIKEMAGFSGYYVELGQPIYAKSFFMGMEFPLGENKIENKRYYSRYYIGKEVLLPKLIWPTVLGAALKNDKESIQHDFFAYIKGIAQPSYFRKQYNSWYDHMTDIDEQIILDSFSEIYHGFEDHGVHLDAYVVDDGWTNYQSVWEFNDKFPHELKNIKAKVNQLGSSLGLWIGPRGGYNGTEVIMSDWLETNSELGFGSKNKLSNDVNIGDFRYLNKMKEKMLEYQKNYDISYWKIDGWLLKPDLEDSSGEFAMHTMTPVYEFLIQLLIDLRQERGDRDCWLNLTSYVNPSPWFLQWVNSLWIQISQDVGFTENAGNDINRMISYRDIQYYEFLKERDIQLPLWSLYNHEPVYATTANTWYMDHQMFATVEEFENYLMFIATRGNSFWEFHYSYSMFDEARWKANARAVKWIEKNYPTLRYSKFIGGSPADFQTYGYHCCNPDTDEEILSLRNPSNTAQTIEVNVDLNDFNIVIGSELKMQSDNIVELQAYEILILQKKESD